MEVRATEVTLWYHVKWLLSEWLSKERVGPVGQQ